MIKKGAELTCPICGHVVATCTKDMLPATRIKDTCGHFDTLEGGLFWVQYRCPACKGKFNMIQAIRNLGGF